MLPADQLELLTAAVDGELTPRQSRRLRRLLAASDEARGVLARLQSDSVRLRNLPKIAPPSDLTERIMAKVATVTPPVPVTPAPVAVPHRRSREWVPVAVAASLLLGVGVTSFLFFLKGSAGGDTGGGVVNNGGPTRQPGPAVLPPETANALPNEHDRLPSAPITDEGPAPRVVARADITPDTAPAPRPKSALPPNHALGGPLQPDLPPFARVEVRLPFLGSASDLDRDDVRATLAAELGRDYACQVNLFVKDPARATELLQAAARASGLTVHADAMTADRLKTRKPTAAFVLFTESLTPTEVRDLLTRFAASDARANARVFETIHVTPLHPADQRDLHANVLGFDVTPAKKPNADPKPVSAGTADQVAKSVAGRGEKSAVLAAYLPSSVRTPPAVSKELAQFAARRTDRKPSTVAVVIVVRYAGN